MPRLDPHDGRLWEDDSPLIDAEVLRHIDSVFEIEPGSASGFTLLSIKRMLDHYPSLKLLNGWAEVFCEQARCVPPRLALVNADVKAQPRMVIQSLAISKVRTVTQSELTCDGVEFVDMATPGVVAMDSSSSGSMVIRYRDQPDLRITEQVVMSGYMGDESTSLSLTPLSEIFYLPIYLENALNRHFQEYANSQRTEIASQVVTQYRRAAPELTLGEVLTVILMDINLDGDEECNEARREIQNRIQACDRRTELDQRNQQIDEDRKGR